MSAIFGVLNIDGQEVDESASLAMSEAMTYWGTEGAGIWRKDNVFLGHLMLYDTPESRYESLPMSTAEEGWVITANARIDNRDELFDALAVSNAERVNLPDSQLILRAYRKWGDECPDHLLGDWAFAIWIPHEHKLFIARDHLGNTSLYYCRNSRFFAFASSVKGLLAHPAVEPCPNELYIGQTLIRRPWHNDSTAYKGIYPILPSHSLTVKGGGVTHRGYWDMENTPDLRLNSDREYLDAFLEVYEEAVRCRLRSHRSIGISLSGGLDSASVAALAARELRERGERLAAFSFVPAYSVGLRRHLADETPFIEATSRHSGSIDVTYVRAEKMSPLAGIEHGLRIHDSPYGAHGNQYWLVALKEAARRQGIGTLLNGQGGNLTSSWEGMQEERILGLIRNGQWLDLLRYLYAWRELGDSALWRAVRRQILKPAIAPALRRYQRFRAGRDAWMRYSPINSDFARSLGFADEIPGSKHDPSFHHISCGPTSGLHNSARDIRIKAIERSIYTGLGARHAQMGAAFAMYSRDPTVDKRVVMFCLSIPVEQYVRANQSRLLIRRAMEGILPTSVQWNTRRSLQTAELIPRLLHSRHEVEAALSGIEKSALAQQWLDIPKRRCASRDMFSIPPHGADDHADGELDTRVRRILLRGLAFGLFLSRFD